MSSSSSSISQSRAIGSVFALCTVNLLNYVDRYTVASVLTEIQEFYNINNQDAGMIQTVFFIFFIFSAPIFGYLGDRYNRKWLLFIGVSVWISAVVGSSFIPKHSFHLFLLLRGLVGIGEASYCVIGPTILADMFPVEKRRKVLMLFFFAIPLGSGLGYMTGSTIYNLTGQWQWGVRSTAIVGFGGLLSLLFIVREPRMYERVQTITEGTGDGYLRMCVKVWRVPTFALSTLAATGVLFATGSLSWWVPTALNHSKAWSLGLNSTDDLSKIEKNRISLIVGGITVVSGVLGVGVGTALSNLLRSPPPFLSSLRTLRSDPVSCALGVSLATPTLAGAIVFMHSETIAFYVFAFFAFTGMCFMWAINVNMQMSVIVLSRRNVANSWLQTFTHIFGDASGPYVIGAVSDALSVSSLPKDRFDSLQKAFILTNVTVCLSCILFVAAAYFILEDQQTCQREIEELEEKSEDCTGDISSLSGEGNKGFEVEE